MEQNTNNDEALRARAQAEYDRLKAQVDAARAAAAPTAPPVKPPVVEETPAPAKATAERPTIGNLISDISSQASTLVRGEIEHAQLSLMSKVKSLGVGGVLLAAAGFVALYMLGMLFITAGLVLSVWLPAWAGFGIVTLLLLVVAGVLAIVGKKKIDASKNYQVGKGISRDVTAFKDGLKK